MRIRWTLALLFSALALPIAQADTTIVDDDFESYNDDTALQAVWQPRIGSGAAPPFNLDDGILTTDDTLFPGIEGQGVDHLGGSVMQHSAVAPGSEVFASATESIEVQGDIYVSVDNGNSRMSIGLRNRSVDNDANVGNLLEMGIYNADGVDPTDGTTVVTGTNFGYRLVLFDEIVAGAGIVQQPNWLYFEFDPVLDIDDTDPLTTEPTPDGLVGLVDIGAGWHQYTATITPDSVTMEMDLFRDGVVNLTRDQEGAIEVGVGDPGVDASVTWNLSSATNGFDSFRIGSPSGISSSAGVAFDNVSLKLIDVMTGGGTDADGDGDVDGADFLALQRDDPSLIAQWQTDYPVSASLSAATVPEPTSIAILLFASAGLLTLRRR